VLVFAIGSRPTATGNEVFIASLSSLWSEEGDLYFAGMTTDVVEAPRLRVFPREAAGQHADELDLRLGVRRPARVRANHSPVDRAAAGPVVKNLGQPSKGRR
jgi:hypothetical protein